MKTCVIFAAAEFDGLSREIGPEDYTIAADGGLRHTNTLGITPDEVLGDFDSLGYVPEASTVYPVEKDDTDTMLAVRRGLELGYRRFEIYGGLEGKRLDHTVANFQTLGFLAENGAVGFLIGKEHLCCCFKNASLTFPPRARGDFSLFCLGKDAKGVTIKNLYYEAEDITLTSFFPLGVSNHFTEKPAEITVKDGTLLAIWQRTAGFPKVM